MAVNCRRTRFFSLLREKSKMKGACHEKEVACGGVADRGPYG
jgi:hypothetical protein